MADSAEWARARLVDHLRDRGIADEQVLAAIGAVPRHRFAADVDVATAYEDCALPIGHRATISQPLVVARMMELAAPRRDDLVLDVGTGSGYAAAVAAELAGRVVGIERVPALVNRATAVLTSLGAPVTVHLGDGWDGRPADAPYDVILVAATAGHVPTALVEQLAPGGRMVLPLRDGSTTRLTRLRLVDGELRRDDHDAVRFVPLVRDDG